MSNLPIVCIPCNRTEFQGSSIHFVRHSYIRALIDVVKCMPLLIPATGKDFNLKDISKKIDGIFLTGAASHVCPTNYGAEREFEEHDLDKERDETALPLIRSAVELDIPMIAICRGFQEMNVAFGGTLHQSVQKQPGKMDHRANYDLPFKERYEFQRHKIKTQKGGIFERLELPLEFTANSIHQQGIDRLAPGLHVEGVAEDGLIEAVSVPKKRFILGTQWHPEGDFWLNPVSKKLLEEFGRAIRMK